MLSNAPEVWQYRMNQILEGLARVEVIADDFLICGSGETTEEAMANHDVNLQNFLIRPQEHKLKLNPDKVKLRHPLYATCLLHQTLARLQ